MLTPYFLLVLTDVESAITEHTLGKTPSQESCTMVLYKISLVTDVQREKDFNRNHSFRLAELPV